MSRGTTGRKVRIDDDRWLAGQAAAAAANTNAAEVMRDALDALIEVHEAGVPEGHTVRVRVDLVPVEVAS